MKKFMLAAVLALVAIATQSAPVTSGSKLQTDGNFTTAQRYCPNGRC